MKNELVGVLVDTKTQEIKKETVFVSADTVLLDFEEAIRSKYIEGQKYPIPGILDAYIVFNSSINFEEQDSLIPSCVMYDDEGNLIPETMMFGNLFICRQERGELVSLVDREIEIILHHVSVIKSTQTDKSYNIIGFSKSDAEMDPIMYLIDFLKGEK